MRSRGAASGRPGVLYNSQGSARRSLTGSCLSEEAHSLMSKSPFFGSWDPDVLRAFVEYALVEDASGQIRLKCTNFQVRGQVGTREWPADSAIQEAAVFADGTRCNEAWSAIPHIDERIPVKWLVPPGGVSVLGSYELMQETLWSRPENTSNSLIPTAAHLVSPNLVIRI